MRSLTTLPRFIYITGCDGTGKSTQARLLLDQLETRGIKTQHLWLRFPFFCSIPLLAYARWRGLSWYEERNGVRHGYWDFRRSWFLRTLLPWTLLLDAALATATRVYPPLLLGKTIVCERFALDMVVDLSLAAGDAEFYRRRPAACLLRLLPAGSRVLVLDLDAGTVRDRRPTIKNDRRLDVRLEMYRTLSKSLGLQVLSSSASRQVLHQSIWREIETDFCSDERAGYAKARSYWVHRLLQSPLVAVASHWTFQSLLYMDPTERWFKIGLDLVLTLVGALLLGSWLSGGKAWLSAFVLAHTLNFLFNGHLWGVLKHYGFVNLNADQFDRYIQSLRQRARKEPSIQSILVYGSLVGSGWSPSSDLDARILRHTGIINGIRSCWFLLRERSRALFARFPVDIYVVDSRRSLEKLRSGERAVDLLGQGRQFTRPQGEEVQPLAGK
jgi:hypothetical protein